LRLDQTSFKDDAFDVVASFLALQDIQNTRGHEGLLAAIDEACRTVKKGGTVAMADDSFLSCKPDGDQGRLFETVKRYWCKLLPSIEILVNRMRKNGISGVRVL